MRAERQTDMAEPVGVFMKFLAAKAPTVSAFSVRY
jgi:hypothetical protein